MSSVGMMDGGMMLLLMVLNHMDGTKWILKYVCIRLGTFLAVLEGLLRPDLY